MSTQGATTRRRTVGEFATVRQVRAAHREAGGNFFEWLAADRVQEPRVDSGVHGGRYFVTSMVAGLNRPLRRWTVHEILDDGFIRVVGEWYAYGSAQEAHAAAAARAALKGGAAR